MSARKIAVIGAGPMGLACAYELLKQGYVVDLYEKGARLGGMSVAFEFAGLTIERYYHFICRTDYPLFDLLAELQLSDKLHWQNTKMGFFYQGKLYRWGNPWHLLTFPHLDLISKLRYAVHIFVTQRCQDWSALDQLSAIAWLERWVGKKAYAILWDYLFELKFYEHKHTVSAAWIGTRIKRVALSRRSLFTETLGFLEGGSETLLNALQDQVLKLGGHIHLNSPIERVLVEQQQVQGLQVAGQVQLFEGVVSTVPLPYIPHLVPDLPLDLKEKISNIRNAGVACVILKLSSALTENFWLNINDPKMGIPGLIEYSNLYPLPYSIVYAPFYRPHSHPHYQQSDESLIEEVLGYLGNINPQFSRDWVLAAQVSRYEFAQPICTKNFYQQLPPLRTPIAGFLMADTTHYYPEDRSISESVNMGRQLAVEMKTALMDRMS